MSGDWKRGDVAITKDGDRLLRGSAYWWGTLNGSSGRLYDDREIAPFEPLRRLVVIDAEDAEQVERLLRLWVNTDPDEPAWGALVNNLTAALREFASPAPRIEEPQGLGAVVEDAEGRSWVKVERDRLPWLASIDDSFLSLRWAEIKAVRVLSEGVTP